MGLTEDGFTRLRLEDIKTELEAKFVEKYGEPEDIDSFDKDVDINTTVLHYWKKGVSIFFESKANPVLAGVETDNPESTLYGIKIIGKSKDDIIDLMKKNGHNSFDVEEEDGDESNTKDLRVSYDVSMMDFFFSDNMLMYMNFGVFVDENGNIEKV